MDNKTVIHRIDQPPIEVSPERIIWIDRTRLEDGLCSRKRFIRYELGGMGYVPSMSSNEDLVIGGSTHEGLDLLLQGGSLEKSLTVAEDYFWENIHYSDYLLPEQQEALGWDGCNLAKAFIYSFDSSYLQDLLDNYEVLEVEEEINWLVKELDEPIGKYNLKGEPILDLIVMMSRPDGVLRHKQTGKLWHVSHKTTQEFNPIQIDKLQVDIQRFSESIAIWAKYGEPPKGTLYNYFLKGRRYQDKDLGIERFNTGLIHPYMQRMGPGGDISPEMLSFVYEWQELDGHLLKNKRLGKGWERVAIYNEMDYLLYLSWLENNLVPRYKDYLKSSIVGLKEEYFNIAHAERWLRGIANTEEVWSMLVYAGRDYSLGDHILDMTFPLESSQCYSWNKPCSYVPICWKDQPIESLIQEGKLVERTPNHIQERGKNIE